MTFSERKHENLSDDEFKEMIDLKKAINDNIFQVHPLKQEQFTEYLVRSLRERGG